MKSTIILATILMCVGFSNSHKQQDKFEVQERLMGKWVRNGITGPIALIFKKDAKVDVDFGNDGSVDVSSIYRISDEKITFIDENDAMCHEPGKYRIVDVNKYYLTIDMDQDNCGGRIKSTIGHWTKSNSKDLIKELSAKLANEPKPDLLLTRSRVFLALGERSEATADLDSYINVSAH